MHSIIKLLTLNIKTMKRKDLKLGEYYVYDKRQVLIFKGIKVNTKVLDLETKSFTTQNYSYNLDDIRHATPEEKHWLDVCINKDTFVPREIAMVTFKSKEIDFITGKWYKSTPEANNRGGEIYYGKFLEFRNDAFVASSARVSGSIIDLKYTFNSGYIWELVTDLTEIQHLLPTNHPDKIMKPAPEAIMEVFGKFIIGNIVVSLRTNLPWREEGDMFTILPNSKQDMLYYKPSTHSQDRDDWRLATTKECYAYHNGVKNIKQMDSPKETTKPVVSQFLKDDYIVTLQEISGSFPKNHVFKQRETNDYLRVYKDIRGDTNGNTIADISKASLWRYATSQEIMEYDIQNRPVDVSRIGMSPKQNVEPIKTNTMAPDKWCIEMDYGHPDKLEVMNFINVVWKAGMTGSGGFYYLENGKVKCNTLKPKDYDLMSIPQFKRDIMTSSTQSVPYVFTLPPQWYMLVTEENKYDAEVWRWEGNPGGYELEIGQLIGIPDHGGKSHNPGKATTNFGTQISYIQFKAHVLTKKEKGRLITNAFPVGSCVVVTKGSYGKNGKENHCYKIIEHTGVSNGDISLKYQSCNSIGLSHVRVKRATTDQTARYERKGYPYDVKSLETVSKYEINNGMPKYVRVVSYGNNHFNHVLCTDNPAPSEFNNNWNQILIQCGRLTDGSFVPATREEYEAFIIENERQEAIGNKSYKDKSLREICDLCNQVFPIGSVVDFSNNGSDIYTIKEKLYINSGSYVSYVGLPIVYRLGEDTLRCSLVSKPVKTIEDLPKKAKMSDVSALTKHQEPVIVNRQKTKRSKLITINK